MKLNIKLSWDHFRIVSYSRKNHSNRISRNGIISVNCIKITYPTNKQNLFQCHKKTCKYEHTRKKLRIKSIASNSTTLSGILSAFSASISYRQPSVSQSIVTILPTSLQMFRYLLISTFSTFSLISRK